MRSILASPVWLSTSQEMLVTLTRASWRTTASTCSGPPLLFSLVHVDAEVALEVVLDAGKDVERVADLDLVARSRHRRCNRGAVDEERVTDIAVTRGKHRREDRRQSRTLPEERRGARQRCPATLFVAYSIGVFLLASASRFASRGVHLFASRAPFRLLGPLRRPRPRSLLRRRELCLLRPSGNLRASSSPR